MAQRRVVHLILGLGKGGAETTLYQVLKYRHDVSFEQMVISFGAASYYEGPIQSLGIPIKVFYLKRHPLSSLYHVWQELKSADTLCCWMYHSSLIGTVLGKLARTPRIVWCIRHSDLSPQLNKRSILIISKLCAKLSKFVHLIAYNGEKSRLVHEANGYCSANGYTINNGVDCHKYQFQPEAATSLRKELGIKPNRQIILSVTRDAPIKDIPTFLQAVAAAKREIPTVVAVICGNGVDYNNKSLVTLCHTLQLIPREDVFFLGLRNDVSRLMSACDLYVLHSAGEAFPNVLVQAMACECLCISTDVGDCKRILSCDSLVIPPKDPETLSEKIVSCLSLENFAAQKKENRKRVMTSFDINVVIDQYEALF